MQTPHRTATYFPGPEVAHGIMFHHFHGAGHPEVQGSIDAEKLSEMISFLSRGARILEAHAWLEKAQAGQLEPNEIVLTFDDGLLCQNDVAVPVLKDLGHTAIFFVYSSVFQGNLERLEIYRAFRTVHFDDLDNFYARFLQLVRDSDYGAAYRQAIEGFVPDQYIKEFPFYTDGDRTFRFVRDQVLGREAYFELMDQMIENSSTSLELLAQGLWIQDDGLLSLTQDGHIAGLHSHTHPTLLSSLPPAEQEREYRQNAEHLTTLLGIGPVVMSHPSNSYNAATLDILRRIGVRLGFRADMAYPDREGLEYPREDHSNILSMMGNS